MSATNCSHPFHPSGRAPFWGWC